MKLGEDIQVFLAVNQNGDEVMIDRPPVRYKEKWTDEISAIDKAYWSLEDHNSAIILPNGTIEKLIGKTLTWEDEYVIFK